MPLPAIPSLGSTLNAFGGASTGSTPTIAPNLPPKMPVAPVLTPSTLSAGGNSIGTPVPGTAPTQLPANITAPSGATVNPGTGALISHPPIPGTTPAATGTPPVPIYPPANINAANQLNNPSGIATIAAATAGPTGSGTGSGSGLPAAPVVPPVTTPPTTPAAPQTYQDAVTAYGASYQPTQQENDLNNQLATLQSADEANAAREMSTGGSVEAINANDQAEQATHAAQEDNLTRKIAILQANRQTAATGAETVAELEKPISLSSLTGAELVSPTGQVLNAGALGTPSGSANINPATGLSPTASGSDILGYLGASGIDITKYDTPALISAIQNGATAQDIISGKANVAANIKNAGLVNTAVTQTTSGTATTNTLANPLGTGGTNFGTANGSSAPTTNLGTGSTPNGSGSGAATPAGSAATGLSSLNGSDLTLATTGDDSIYKSPALLNAAVARIQKVLPGFNPTIAKANAAAITDQVGKQAAISTAINTADSNFGLLTDTFKNSGVNDLSSPAANDIMNKIKNGALGDSATINFQSAVTSLQDEYSTVLGKGGAPTDALRASAANVISGNYSMSDLISLHNYLSKEGKNVVDSYTKTITGLASGGAQNTSSSKTNLGTPPTTSGKIDVASLGAKYGF